MDNIDTIDTPSKLDNAKTAVKQQLGKAGRALKGIDARASIVENPFAAIGIAVGVGAAIGLIRPMPKRGPLSRAFMSAVGFVGFRLLREAAMTHLGTAAQNLISKVQTGTQSPNLAAQGSQGGNIRYTPAL